MKDKLTNKSIRESNQLNILNSIIKGKDILRNELASENNISIMTVKKIIDDLIKYDIVVEQVQNTSMGRKPKSLSISPRFGSVACINLTSKEYFSYHIFNIYGEIIEIRQFRIDDQYTYLENIERLIAQLKNDLNKTGQLTVGIGLSVPSAYYEHLDIVNYDLIPAFKDLHLKKLFQEAFEVDNVMISHDVFTAAQAEYIFSIPRVNSLFYFYIGDGVGGAYIANGHLLSGENLVAGEVGQFIVSTEQGETTLESAVSIITILEEARIKFPEISFYNVLALYENGDEFITSIINRKLTLINQCLYNISWVLNPSKIVVDSSYKKYADIIAASINTFNERLKQLPILNSVIASASELNEHNSMQGCFDLTIDRWIRALSILGADESETPLERSKR